MTRDIRADLRFRHHYIFIMRHHFIQFHFKKHVFFLLFKLSQNGKKERSVLSEQCGEAIVFLVSFGLVILFKDPLQRHWSVVSVIELFHIENF